MPHLLMALLACSDTTGDFLLREPLAHHAWGFRVEPPIPLPRPSARGWVEVWIGGRSGPTLRAETSGVPSLAYMPGTLADRVEFREEPDGPRVVDVRGTTLDEEGRRWHHVYQPVSKDPARPLVGARWPADDPEASSAAIEGFLDTLAAHGRTHLESVRAKLDCEGCHQLDRPANIRPREHGLVSRGTDGLGFFTPSTLLHDHGPAELYGSIEETSSVTWTCGGVVAAGTRVCPDGTLAVARFDAAVPDAHASAVAASRAALHAWVQP